MRGGGCVVERVGVMRWQISIEIWPHSTGAGAEADQKAAGDRQRYFYVEADCIERAYMSARCIQSGILCNPAVWKAPIIFVGAYPQ